MTDESPAPPAGRPTERRRTLTRRALVAGGGLAAVAAVAGCTTTPRPAPPTGGTTATPTTDPGDPPAPAVTASGGPPIDPMTYAPDDALAGFYALREQVRERRLTIGVLGDSITEGQGATTLQHAYPAQLRDRLRGALPRARGVASTTSPPGTRSRCRPTRASRSPGRPPRAGGTAGGGAWSCSPRRPVPARTPRA